VHRAVGGGRQPGAGIDCSDERSQQQRRCVEQDQHVEEPEMGKGEGRQRDQRRSILRHFRGNPGQAYRPDENRDEQSRHRHIENQQRRSDPHSAVAHETLHSPALEQHAREEARDQEKQRHPVHVHDVEERAQDMTGAVEKDPHLGLGKIGHRRMQENAQEQRASAHRVKRVQALGGPSIFRNIWHVPFPCDDQSEATRL
jgi:hypothetical protein